MCEQLVLDTLKIYFQTEISNEMVFKENNIQLVLMNGQKIKISTKEKA